MHYWCFYWFSDDGDVGDDPMWAILWPSADVSQPETPPGICAFVANKRQTAIRPSDDRAVEAISRPAFGVDFG
jgi:hypothetical protein